MSSREMPHCSNLLANTSTACWGKQLMVGGALLRRFEQYLDCSIVAVTLVRLRVQQGAHTRARCEVLPCQRHPQQKL